jgi:hypothetical protein
LEGDAVIILAVDAREGNMEKVQKSEGLICICAECKKVIRPVGAAVAGARPLVSHGICPECAERLYGDIFRKKA